MTGEDPRIMSSSLIGPIRTSAWPARPRCGSSIPGKHNNGMAAKNPSLKCPNQKQKTDSNVRARGRKTHKTPGI